MTSAAAAVEAAAEAQQDVQQLSGKTHDFKIVGDGDNKWKL